jgi:hypothetical protein
MVGNLKLENFTLSVKQPDLEALLKEAVQAANPEFEVVSVKFEIDRGYEGDYRDAGKPPSIKEAKIELKRKNFSLDVKLPSKYTDFKRDCT